MVDNGTTTTDMGLRPDERACLAVCDRGHMDGIGLTPI